jgi:plasmid stability protein
MGVVDETRQVLQDFLAPELREMRAQIAVVGKRLDLIEEASRIRHENVIQRLEFIQQSFALDKRLSAIEADKRQSA